MNRVAAMVQVPVVDLSAYQTIQDPSTRQLAANSLVQACHKLGFCAITGHGIPKSTILEAFRWQRSLFDLPLPEKMKAPHPAATMPHRGYSGVGVEKVFSRNEAMDASSAKALRQEISDYKESYEIGSEENPEQANIWLPQETLPGFRTWGLELYWQMNEAASRIMAAFVDGLLGAASEDGSEKYSETMSREQQREQLVQMNGQQCNQLRLLHYPAVGNDQLQQHLVARMPAHTDWGSFTLLFQNGVVGGLELEDPATGDWVAAEPNLLPSDALILNIGDFFERVTNGYLKSANHRVTLPRSASKEGSEQLLERYSMPYFVAPLPNFHGSCLPAFVSDETPAKYDSMTYEEYGFLRGKYSY